MVESGSLGRTAEPRSELPRNASTSVGQPDCVSLVAKLRNAAAERADSLLMRLQCRYLQSAEREANMNVDIVNCTRSKVLHPNSSERPLYF